MPQPLNYQYPQIYWVDNSASSPWDPPGSVLPCPPSDSGRPGRRVPPPPPFPPPLRPPPPPPLPSFPPSLLKKRKNHNTGLYLLMMFFLVLVTLVGLALAMVQLFHLQKELAELRKSISPEHVASSLEKQVELSSLPSERRWVKKVAHLTGNPNSRSIPLEWEDTYGMTLLSGVKYKKGGLVINDPGLYFVYSKVFFRDSSCKNQLLNHKVYMKTTKYPEDLVLMEERMMNHCNTNKIWSRSSYLGAVFNLTISDRLYVNVSALSLVNFDESKTFFGLYKL
ncbi:tumor necrosis factor ligand superfamily member 6 [Rhynchocyon petersi]